MRKVFRSTAILSSGSLVSILTGLLAAKVWATFLGTTGLGYLGLLQNVLGFSGLVAGTVLSAGLVRLAAKAISDNDLNAYEAIRRAAWFLFWVLGGATALAMVVFRDAIGTWMLGGAEHATVVVVMSAALLFGAATTVQVSLINAQQRIGTLAQLSVASGLVAATSGVLPVLLWKEQGIAVAVVLSPVAVWLTSTWYLRRSRPPTGQQRPSFRETMSAAHVLLRFGAPFTASMLVGTGVQFLVLAVVLHLLGTSVVGLHRAAVAISVTYLGFLTNAMTLEYFPRVSSVSDRKQVLIRLINEQLQFILLVATPLLLVIMIAAPYVVTLVYSDQFAGAAEILEWQLVGDICKFASWTMGTVILARGKAIVIFAVEILAGVNIMASSWIGASVAGPSGLGIGFFVTYFIHLVTVYLVLKNDINLVLTTSNRRLIILSLSSLLLIRILAMAELAELRVVIAVTIAVMFALRLLSSLDSEGKHDRPENVGVLGMLGRRLRP